MGVHPGAVSEPPTVSTPATGATTNAWYGPLATPPVLAALAIGLAAVLRLPTLAQPLVEAHPWRQTQTAFTAAIYAKEGIDLLNPQVPVLGPPFTMHLEFPLYQAVAAVLIDAGVQTEVALRGLALVSFLATAAVLWLMLSRHVGDRAAFFALLVFLFSPYALLWSRSSMIEYPATLGVVLFMFGTLEWHAGRGRRWFVLAAVAGSVAALIKITTAVFWVAPALLTRRLMAFVLCAIPGGIGLAWTLWAGAQREATPLVDGMSGEFWIGWNLGGDRLALETWVDLLLPTLFWMSMLLLPFALLVIHRSERLIWTWFAIAMIGPMLLFTNLYSIHDYYAVAISPAVAALVGGGLDRMLGQAGRRWPLVAASLITVAVAVLVVSFDYWSRAYASVDDHVILQGAEIVREATTEGENVDLGCDDWDPSIMFYAERKGFAAYGDGTFTTFDDPRVCMPGDWTPRAERD